MSIIIKEIKARCEDPIKAEQILLSNGADYKGIDHQVDTYFNVPNGRLKLREGNIETTLIAYERKEVKDIKNSEVALYKSPNDAKALKKVLTASCGIKAIVDKKRKIFFIDNVKFHIDEVEQLGGFIEIEAIGEKGKSDEEVLYGQCQYYITLLEIKSEDLIDQSYSDMMLAL